MKEHWAKAADRFDSMSLRERILVAAGLIVVTVYMSYFLLVDPLVAAKPRLVQAIKQERAMLKAVEAIIIPQPGQGPDADAVKRAYQDALLQQVDELSESLKGMQKALVPPEQMAKLLEGMVVQVGGVELISLRKLPVQPMKTARSAEATPPATAVSGVPGNDAPAGAVYQHGFEITIQGSYAGLYQYLARLEKLPWRMFWGKLSLDAEHHPNISLTMVVYTMSLHRAWLTI